MAEKVPPASLDESAQERRAARASMPIQRFTLGAEPDENLESTTTADERLAMVLTLSRLAYEVAGRLTEPPPRHALVGRVIRPGTP